MFLEKRNIVKNLKYAGVLLLLVLCFGFGCKDDEPSGTPPVISDIKLYLYKGLDIDYAYEPEITEWREGDYILGVLTIYDPDKDVTTVSYSYKCLDNNTTRGRIFQYITQNKNPYFLDFSIDNLTPGNWMLTVKAEDKGHNVTTFNFENVMVVNQH